MSLCSFTCLLLRSVCCTGNSSQQMSLQCLSTINVTFSDEDKIWLKKHINTLSMHSYGRSGIKICALKMQFVRIVSISAEFLQKIWILICEGRVATCLRWGGWCCVGFVANFTSFSAVQKFWKLVRFDKVTESLKVETFSETQCINRGKTELKGMMVISREVFLSDWVSTWRLVSSITSLVH